MDGRKVTFCILPNDSSTHTYRVRGTHLGRTNITVLAEIDSSYPGVCGPEVILNKRDVVYKTITVEPEGYPSEVTKSVLLCGNGTNHNIFLYILSIFLYITLKMFIFQTQSIQIMCLGISTCQTI